MEPTPLVLAAIPFGHSTGFRSKDLISMIATSAKSQDWNSLGSEVHKLMEPQM